ncbi:MAG: glycosyltransferase, partial [Candidatus Acidiferrales bacterium]
LGFYGAWDTLLEASKLLPVNGTRMIFIGDGASRARLEESSRGSATVRFLPFRPPEEIPCVMAAGDLHIVTVRRGLGGVVVPSKLYSILAAGRPILAVAPEDTDVARIVRAADCGLVADPDKASEVAAAIQTLKSDPVRLATMGERARKAAQNYARVKELEKFVAIIEEVHPPAHGSTPT